MSRKTASAQMAKPLYATTSALTKKLLGSKTAQYAKGGKLAGFKPKAAMAGMKPKIAMTGTKFKAAYGSHKPTGWKIHDGGYGAAVAVGEPTEARESVFPKPDAQERDLAEGLVAHLADDSPDVNVLCDNYKLRREELGRLTGFSLRALAEWASGKLPSQPAKRRLHEVRRLLDALAEIVKPEHIT